MNYSEHNRIVVIGSTCVGKSTMAKLLAEKTGVEFVELDELHWEANWVEAPDDVFRERVERAVSAEAWVVAGNYSVVRDIVWPKADALIWLDYSFRVVFWRLITRTIRRVSTKEKLFANNVENAWMHFKIWSQESLIHWLFKTYWRRKREFSSLLAHPDNAHLTVHHFKKPTEAARWIESL